MRNYTPLVGPVLVLLVAGCGAADDTGALPGARTQGEIALHRGNGADPSTLDPAQADETSGASILADLYEGLLSTDVNGSLIPGVAEQWAISNEGRTYTFQLSEAARWSNGDPVTAEDFVAAFRRMVNPTTASPNGQFYLQLKNAQAVISGEQPEESLGVHTIDPHTLVVELESPTPWLLGMFATRLGYPIHQPSLATYGDRFARPGTLVGNGAYVLTEWILQDHITLERNAYYRNADTVEIEKIYYHPTEDESSELLRFRAGELHYTHEIPKQQYEWIQENLPGALRSGPYLGVYYFSFDTTEPPFDDVRVRKALSMVLDRDLIADDVVGTGEIAAYNMVPEYVTQYPAPAYEWRDWTQQQRLEEAQRLYSAAGYGPDDPLAFTITYNTSANHRQIIIALASLWKESLGVEVSLVNQEWRVLLEQRRDRSNWDMMRMGWIGGWDDAYQFLEVLLEGSQFNDSGFSNPDFDELLLSSNRVLDPEARAAVLAEAEELMLQNYPVMPLYFYVTNHLVNDEVTGYAVNILDRDISHNYGLGLAP